MIQIVIYTVVIAFAVVLTAYLALHVGSFIFAYSLYCVGKSICGKEASFKEFWREVFPSPGGKQKTEEAN